MSYFCRLMIVIYTRRQGLAGGVFLRSFSLDDDGWSDEAEVTNARAWELSQRQMCSMCSGGNIIVYPGGGVVNWLAKNVLFELCPDTLAESGVIRIPPRHSTRSQNFAMVNTLLGVSPERGLFFVLRSRRQSASGESHYAFTSTAMATYGTRRSRRSRWTTTCRRTRPR